MYNVLLSAEERSIAYVIRIMHAKGYGTCYVMATSTRICFEHQEAMPDFLKVVIATSLILLFLGLVSLHTFSILMFFHLTCQFTAPSLGYTPPVHPCAPTFQVARVSVPSRDCSWFWWTHNRSTSPPLLTRSL